MCTVYWERGQKTVRLWFNRDEQRTRKRAILPDLRTLGERKAIFAIDPEGEGTWLGVNDSGIVVGILNLYGATISPGAAARSRGKLVLDLLEQDSIGEIDSHLQAHFALRDGQYGPFELFILTTQCERYYRYDGSDFCDAGKLPSFLTSSSYRTDDVCQWRRQFWKQVIAVNVNNRCLPVEELMRLRNKSDPAFGVCMDRVDARTVSLSCIELENTYFRYKYMEREPLGKGFGSSVDVVGSRFKR